MLASFKPACTLLNALLIAASAVTGCPLPKAASASEESCDATFSENPCITPLISFSYFTVSPNAPKRVILLLFLITFALSSISFSVIKPFSLNAFNSDNFCVALLEPFLRDSTALKASATPIPNSVNWL